MKNFLVASMIVLLLATTAYAFDSVEGFNTLKLGKNIDECLKEGKFDKITPSSDSEGGSEKGVAPGPNEGRDAFALNAYSCAVLRVPDEIKRKICGDNLIAAEDLLSKFANITDPQMLSKYPMCKYYLIWNSDVSPIKIGDESITDNSLNCYTFDNKIVCITFCAQSQTIYKAFVEKYGEPNFKQPGISIWQSGSVVLQYLDGRYYIADVKALYDIVQPIPAMIDKDMAIIDTAKAALKATTEADGKQKAKAASKDL